MERWLVDERWKRRFSHEDFIAISLPSCRVGRRSCLAVYSFHESHICREVKF